MAAVQASVVIVTLQAWGQQRVDAMHSAIIFGLEPVFAAWAMLDKRMGGVAVCGATLVVAALVFSQMERPRAATGTINT